jgi:Cu+-exporting ATPase
MTCGSCASRLERVIGRAPGVASVAVTLEPGRAVVRGQLSDERVRELVAEAGFEPR